MSNETKKKATIGTAVGLALLLLLAWSLGFLGGTDPAVAEVQRVFDEAIANGGPPPREMMQQQMSQLSDAQRRQFFMQNRDTMREMMTRRMTETLQLPPEERQREIAARADRVIEMRQGGDEPERRGPPGGGPPGGRGFGEMSQADRMKRILDFTTPEMRGAFTEMKRLIDDELASRGEPPLEGREMRRAMGRGR